MINHFIQDGLTVDEMIKKAEFIAEVLEAGVQSKQANAGQALAAGAGAGTIDSIINFLSTRLGNTSDAIVRGGAQAAANVAPTVLMGSVALPIAAGYYGGNMLGKMTDPGDAKLDELKKREEIAELKQQTERLRQQRRARQHAV